MTAILPSFCQEINPDCRHSWQHHGRSLAAAARFVDRAAPV